MTFSRKVADYLLESSAKRSLPGSFWNEMEALASETATQRNDLQLDGDLIRRDDHNTPAERTRAMTFSEKVSSCSGT